jgi:hypothetical protein
VTTGRGRLDELSSPIGNSISFLLEWRLSAKIAVRRLWRPYSTATERASLTPMRSTKGDRCRFDVYLRI